MKTIKVEGKNKRHTVLIYTLSTCAPCKLTRQFLDKNNIEYEYVDVDLCDAKDQAEIGDDVKRRGGVVRSIDHQSFLDAYPTIIVDNTTLITGYNEDRIKEALKI